MTDSAIAQGQKMDTLTAIVSRYSEREYDASRPVARELLEKIVDAGRRAPTGRNEQPWEFVVVTEPAMRRAIAELTNYGKFIADAPACIVVACRDCTYYIEDGAAATENILLAATALGVQSCWVAGDKKPYCDQIRLMLGMPESVRVVSMIALGYAKTPGVPREKRPLAELLHWERF